MGTLQRLLISFLLIVTVGACEGAKMSLANNGKHASPSEKPIDDDSGKDDEEDKDDEKPKCGREVSTIAVHDFKDTLIGSMTPWEGALDAIENYNYQKEASDILIGPKGQARFASHFFYRNEAGLFLYIVLDSFHDFNGDAFVDLSIQTFGNDLKDHVVVSDERREMYLAETNKTLKIRTYRGEFEYQRFGDGAVIGPFLGNDWEVEVNYESASEIERVHFADSAVGGMKYPIFEQNLKTIRFFPTNLGLCKLPKAE